MQNKYVDDSGWYTRRWKIRFVQAYAEALGLQYGEELVWIPISPSYQEPHDLLGYLHSNGTFIESETKLVRALMKAKENQNQLYIIVLMK